MKHTLRKSLGVILATCSLTSMGTALAQQVQVTSTTTTSDGTISEFGPQAIVITTGAGVQPVRYIANDTTHYVDENGNPVAVTTIKSGIPVSVYYTKVGDTLVASKVMVRRSTTVVPMTTSPAVVEAATMSMGTIGEFGADRITIRTEASPDPLNYSYSKETTYVDENGVPVAISTVQSGAPATVYYTKVGDKLMATKVIVRKGAPIIETKKTTTTTTTQDK